MIESGSYYVTVRSEMFETRGPPTEPFTTEHAGSVFSFSGSFSVFSVFYVPSIFSCVSFSFDLSCSMAILGREIVGAKSVSILSRFLI